MSIDKDSVGVQKPRKLSPMAAFFWRSLGMMAAFTIMAPVWGITARLVYESFMWGWQLLGFAA